MSRAMVSLLWEKVPPTGLIAQVKGLGQYMITSPQQLQAGDGWSVQGWFMLYLLPPNGAIEWLRASQSVEKLKFAAQEDLLKRMMEP